MVKNSPRIVVGYDGSSDANSALDWAAQSAATRQQPLDVVIVATDLAADIGPFRTRDEETVEQWRTDASDRLKELDVVHCTVEVRRGAIVPELVEASDGAEMLVVGSRGHSLPAGSVTGSVSQHAARHAHCPVVAVRPCRSPHARRIVVGVDDSPESDRALRFAFNRASDTGEAVVAVHGHYSLKSRMLALDGAASEADMRRLREADRSLAEVTAGIAAEFPDVEFAREAISVRPAQLLVDCSGAASLVVVGSRGRDAFKDLLLGSVSQHVLHNAECPVAVVR
jgi:nucleotide-binding universal stress UspA family protein